MKPLMILLVLVGGCAERYTPKILVEGHPPRIYEYIDGDTPVTEIRGWYNAQQLDEIVREYVRQNEIDFDFRGTETQFWVGREREYLAEASYSSGFGSPVLSVKISWDGHVKQHDIGIAVCGTGLELAEDTYIHPDEDRE